jgi:GGDEF domain-containing protein
MHIFDRMDPAKLDRRDTQLWMLAIAMIVILASGIALLLYPSAFTMPVVLSGPFLRQVFFSFCTLSLLVVGYLMERRIVVGRLRAQLREEESRARRMLNEASADLLETLPGVEHFRDRLTMEFRRAANAQLPLSLLLIRLMPSDRLSDSGDILTAYGDAAKAMLRKLRGEDSIYLFRPAVFGVVLPGVRAADAHRVELRLGEGLTDASGASDRFSFSLRAISFPENVTSAHEMERAALSFAAEERHERAAA